MKKILFSLLVAGIFTASCTDKNAYTITGSFADDAQDGQYAYLLQPDSSSRELNIADSVLIENKQFVFNGIAPEKPDVRFIRIKGDPYIVLPVVLEKGSITLIVDAQKVVSIGGTPMNNELEALEKKSKELYDAMENELDPQIQKELWEELRNTVYEYLKPNMTNWVGQYFFFPNIFNLEDEDVLELISLSSPEFKANERVKKIEQVIKIRVSTGEGTQFADVKGFTQDGKEVALSDYAGKGKVVLVDFWASWCRPCLRSLPDLKAIYEKYKDKGFEIVGISLDQNGDDWKAATVEHGLTWSQFSNLKGWDEPASKTYGVNSIPHTVLINKTGTIVLRGSLSKEELENKLDELINAN